MVEANAPNQPQNSEEMKSPQDMQFSTPGQNENMVMGGDSGAATQAPPMTSLKMKGMPYSVTRDEIINFYAGSNVIEDSIKIGTLPDGKLTGEACVQFNSDEDCQAAHSKLDQKYIGSRWVKLIRVVNEEYQNFEQDQAGRYSGGGNDYGARRGGGNFSRGGGDFDSGFRGGRGRGGRGGRGRGRGGFNQNNDFGGNDDGGSRGGRGGFGDGGRGGRFGGQTVRLSDFVNAENQYTTLKMRGLPFSVSEREIRDFF